MAEAESKACTVGGRAGSVFCVWLAEKPSEQYGSVHLDSRPTGGALEPLRPQTQTTTYHSLPILEWRDTDFGETS